MRKRDGMRVTSDLNEAYALVGFLKRLSVDIKTPRHIGPVMHYAHSIMVSDFKKYMSLIAGGQPARFHHVYEWNMSGVPAAALWEDVLLGHGGSRIATFKWKPSATLVPVNEQAAAKRVKKVHRFIWKAPVMEYSIPVKIEPSSDKKGLSYFTGPVYSGQKWDLKFTSKPITVNNPGGKQTTGAFTREYVGWWAGPGGSASFDNSVKKTLENDLGKAPIEKVTKKYRKNKVKTFGLSALGDARSAQMSGEEAARRWLSSRSTNYLREARAREAGYDG